MSKNITQYDGTKVVARYATILTASRITGADQSHISKVARGRRDTAGGYKWRYTRGNLTSLKHPGAVAQVDKTGNVVAVYADIEHAVKLTGSNLDRIVESIYTFYQRGHGRIVNGYRFVPAKAV